MVEKYFLTYLTVFKRFEVLNCKHSVCTLSVFTETLLLYFCAEIKFFTGITLIFFFIIFTKVKTDLTLQEVDFNMIFNEILDELNELKNNRGKFSDKVHIKKELKISHHFHSCILYLKADRPVRKFRQTILFRLVPSALCICVTRARDALEIRERGIRRGEGKLARTPEQLV